MGFVINKSKISSDTEQAQTTVVNNLNFDKITAKETGITLKYTDNVTYDLDKIIFTKRRDNVNCPLILYVDMESPDDSKIMEVIIKLILDDYKIDYVDNATENDEMYYKNRIKYVPSFYTVFDDYFNKYYSIYYNSLKNDNTLGSISLTTVIEKIQENHDNIYNNILPKDDRGIPYNNCDPTNKPKIEYEYGSLPGCDDDSDIISNFEKLKLAIKDKNLLLKYNGEFIDETAISIEAIISEIITADDVPYRFTNDFINDPNITVYDDVYINDFITVPLITAEDVTFDLRYVTPVRTLYI